MRLRPILVLVVAASACTEDPFVAPTAVADRPAQQAAGARLTGTPETTAALALIDSVLAHPADTVLVIIDGIIVQDSSLAHIPREFVRAAETVQATICDFHGPRRARTVLMITTTRGGK